MQKIVKVFVVCVGKIIKCVDYFQPRSYMKMYNWYLKKIGINVHGIPRYISPSVDFDGQGYSLTHIGNNVVISKNVVMLNHDYSITCGLRSIGEEFSSDAYWLKEIWIRNNVFIGANSIILPGTTIGDNCIIGAGSVVRGKIASNSIVTGNPGRVVDNIIEWSKRKKSSKDYFFD